MSQDKKMREDRRFVAKLKKEQGANGEFLKVVVDNINAQNQDGSANPYHQGVFLWCDAKTGKYYQVKQMKVGGVSSKQSEKGFVKSLFLDLEDSYHVTPLSNEE